MASPLPHTHSTSSHASLARKALEDVERSHSQLVAERNAAQELADKYEKRYNDLQARLDEVGHSSSEAEVVRIRLEEELQRERDQHGADLDERDFAMKQTQQTYQGLHISILSSHFS